MLHALFYKQHFYKQRRVETGKKIKQKLSNTLRLNLSYLKIIRFLYPLYHPKIIGDIQKKCTKNKCACFNDVLWLMAMKMRLKMKIR